MKRLVAGLLIAALIGLPACGKGGTQNGGSQGTDVMESTGSSENNLAGGGTENGVVGSGAAEGAVIDGAVGMVFDDAAGLLSAVWDNFTDPFPSYGGSIENNVENAPGKLDVTDTNTMTNSLLIPEDVQGNVSDVATLFHMMNANTFTGAAMKVDNMEAEEVARKLRDSFKNNQFMCGIPDKIVVVSVGDFIVYAYGEEETIDRFKGYVENMDNAKVLIDERYD